MVSDAANLPGDAIVAPAIPAQDAAIALNIFLRSLEIGTEEPESLGRSNLTELSFTMAPGMTHNIVSEPVVQRDFGVQKMEPRLRATALAMTP